jgi:hypothetical protein
MMLFLKSGRICFSKGTAEELAAVMMIAGFLGMVTADVWSVIDAVRVAKVNNLAWRDSNNTGFSLQLKPYISPIQTYKSTNIQAGLSLKVNF